MDYLDEIDYTSPDFGDLYDELPLWSAPFGLMLLDRVSLRTGMTILDRGAGTGFLTIELGSVPALTPWSSPWTLGPPP